MFKLSSSILGGFRVAAGNGWQPFDENFDALTVGVSIEIQIGGATVGSAQFDLK